MMSASAIGLLSITMVVAATLSPSLPFPFLFVGGVRYAWSMSTTLDSTGQTNEGEWLF